MSTSVTSSTSEPTWRNVLGLADPHDRDWGLVRAAQLNTIRRFAAMRLLFNLALFFLVACAVWPVETPARVVAWVAGSAVLMLLSTRGKLRDRAWQIGTATQRDLHVETLWLTLNSLGYAAALFMFGPHGGAAQLLVLTLVTTCAMAGCVLYFAGAPLATIYFLLVAGTSMVWTLVHIGMIWPAIVAGFFTLGLGVATMRAGRAFVMGATAEHALAEKTEVVSLLLREFEDSGGDWMWQTDASKCLTHVSPRFAVALGVEVAAVEAKPLLRMLAGDGWETGAFSPGLRDLAEKMKRRESFSDITLPVTIAGDVKWWELSGAPRFDDHGVFIGFRGVGSDVTTQRLSADKIKHMARFDGLTGLPNRLQITEALGQAMAEADQWRTRCAFMMIDLDRFKSVNDTLGHPTGDRLLTRVAERLRSIMTDRELCGRLGGDEFAVVVRDASDNERLVTIASTIIDTLSQPYEIDNHTIYIGASVGTAVAPRDGRTVEMLTRSADLALYRSKDQGGGAHNAYEPQLHVHAEERRVLEIALRKALERNEFQVAYQPVVSADGTRIESFEALIRWHNPELGMVSPARFIPVAEDARLIGPIGEWVLRTACEEATHWPESVRVAVNVSTEQLAQPAFVTQVMQALAHTGLAPRRLELEVTESVFMREGTQAIAVLDQLLGLGIRLSLDDFGTGYSSLGYLSRTKFDTIKVDRSFVQAASKGTPEAIAIIRAVVALADSLGMSTTAEGVETEAELATIRNLGCRKIQGYLFGRPMPATDARALFVAAASRVA